MRKMNWRIWKNIKLPRGKFLKRLDWYIIKKFLGTYVFAIALIISIAVVFDFNEKMDRFMSHEAPWNAIVFDYYLNFIPYFANLFSPLFVFIAVIFFTSKLAENSEIIAMFSTGMSFKRMLRPYMVSAAIIAVVTFCLGSYVIPKGSVTRINFEDKYYKPRKANTARNIQLEVDSGVIAYIERFEDYSKTRLSNNVFCYNQGMGTNRYLNWEKLYNMENNGYMQQLVTVEAEVFRRTCLLLDSWRQQGSIDSQEMQKLYQDVEALVRKAYTPLMEQ